MEVETQVTIAAVLGYLTSEKEAEPLNQTNELGRILNGLILSVGK